MSIGKTRGLGDKIEKYITEPTGIKKVVDKVSEVTKKDCGCVAKKKKLNEWMPSKRFLKPSEFEWLLNFFKSYNGKKINSFEDRDMIIYIYNRVNPADAKPVTYLSQLDSTKRYKILEELRMKVKEYEKAG